jgi:hypothetical protein
MMWEGVMSSPIDRSFDKDGISPYAPKWARDLDSVPKQQPAGLPLHMVGGDEMIAMVPSDSPNFEAEHFQPPASLVPSLVPEQPIQESWLRDSARSLVRGDGGGSFFPQLFAVFLAALIAFVIVVEMPKILGFVSKQRSTADSFGARFDSVALRPLAEPATIASEPMPAGAARSDRAPSSMAPRFASIDPAAAAPVGRLSPVRPAEPTAPVPVPDPAPANPAPATSLPANPAPAVVVPPVADLAPSAASVPVPSIVKTVPIQPEKPVRPLGRDEIETLLKQGKDFVSVGDFASARIVFGRVAQAHDARGAMALAATYDPIVLTRIGAKGATPDVAKAREWYVKARDLGSLDAAPQLEALANNTR